MASLIAIIRRARDARRQEELDARWRHAWDAMPESQRAYCIEERWRKRARLEAAQNAARLARYHAIGGPAKVIARRRAEGLPCEGLTEVRS